MAHDMMTSQTMATAGLPVDAPSSADAGSLLPLEPLELYDVPDMLDAFKQNDVMMAYMPPSQSSTTDLPPSMSGLPGITPMHDVDPDPPPPVPPAAAAASSAAEPRIQAFAKLEFDDGHFYVNTYSFILGRDVRAARAAHQREVRARHLLGRRRRRTSQQSSSGGGHTTPGGGPPPDDSAIMGSVVSDRGGIMGFDPDLPSAPLPPPPPPVPHSHLPPPPPPPAEFSRKSSISSSVDAGDPSQLQSVAAAAAATDYNALAMESLNNNEDNNNNDGGGGGGDAKPVDALALLPSPDACPTIPIHPPATFEGNAHKGISRKHVRIAYNFDTSVFEMEVIGRNGAFIGADFLQPGQIRPLHSGDYIQIGGVRVRFLLPDVPVDGGGDEEEEEEAFKDSWHAMKEESGDGENLVAQDVRLGEDEDDDDDEEEEEEEEKHEAVLLEEEERQGQDGVVDGEDLADEEDIKTPTTTKKTTKKKENNDQQSKQRKPSSVEGPPLEDGEPQQQQQPVRRRGPGRPPKDGIMSKRERAELAREQKAKQNGGNDGITNSSPQPPPPSTQSITEPTPDSDAPKPEKRKYTKRKRPADEVPVAVMDMPLPTTEGSPLVSVPPLPPTPQQQQLVEEEIKVPPSKKRKPSRSPSPVYPPESAYTAEDLAKPPYNYAVLIYDALSDAGTPLTLKQIYRSLKLKYPYFRFKCETEGWTSSVRHNLNGNGHLFMHAERDGKGWSWQLRPGASVEKEKKRRPSPPPTPSSHLPSADVDRLYGNHHHHHHPAPPPPPPPPPPLPLPLPLPHNPEFSYPSSTTPLNRPGGQEQQQQPSAKAPPPKQHSLLPESLQKILPAAFFQGPTVYVSPYDSDGPPPPQQQQSGPRIHQPQRQQQQHQPFHNFHIQRLPHQKPPPRPSPQQPNPTQPPAQRPPPPPPPPSFPQMNQPQMHVYAPPPAADGVGANSFKYRANKAIDDFEEVLMEDYVDKNHVREVLKSARARALGEATSSSVPGGEPKDEAVILDALRNLVGSLKNE